MKPGFGGPHFESVLRHADDNLILAQRLSAWISRAPDLEIDIALGNIGLDHLGVARALLSHAGELEGNDRDEDDLAMFRNERQFRNLILVEQPNGDFAATLVRSLFIDAYQVLLWRELSSSADKVLAGVAQKGAMEARYHLHHSRLWAIRFGDGTDKSHHRMQQAVDDLWRFTGEMFLSDAVDHEMMEQGIGVDPSSLADEWRAPVTAILEAATLEVPTDDYQRNGGRQGFHSDHLGHLLGEMQWMQKSCPGLTW
ncbi:MAG: phenylacetate-CoA oxygenase subunit PaaC [Acidimicrobiia bacterium]|nr:phenylacetate-CoA oxygenase subunit PaaC [Acidimicrobiia bacterium]